MEPSAAILLDDPLERLFAFHRKAERQLAALGRLPVLLEIRGVGADASAIASAALHCFGAAMALHHREQERDLIPLLERRIAEPAELVRFRHLRVRIERDHRDLDLVWRELRRPLSAIAEGLERGLPAQPLGYFRVLSALHISAEEPELHALAQRHLDPSDREALARRIHARRVATKPSSI